MNILSSFLFAISANIDNFVVGLSYGISGIKIGFLSSFIISLISFIGTIISMFLSKAIINHMPESLSNLLGSIMLIFIGIWTIVKPLLKNKESNSILENPDKADKDKSSHIDPKESISLAFALTINNIGLGVGASITGLSIILTSLLTFAFSLFMIKGGYILGSRYLSKVFTTRATLISGFLIIALGIFEIFV